MKVTRFLKNRLSLLNVLTHNVFNQQLIDSRRTVMRAKSSGCLWDGFIGSVTATLQIKVTEMLEEIIYIFLVVTSRQGKNLAF